MILAIYLLAGACAGLVAGLFGVGGGIVVVPVLVVVFESQGFDSQILTHMAIGTSLATIVFTSISSVLNHHRLGSVDWSIFKPMSVGIVLGSVIGVVTVLQLDGELVKKLIGGFAIFVAFKNVSSVISCLDKRSAGRVLGDDSGWCFCWLGVFNIWHRWRHLNRSVSVSL